MNDRYYLEILEKTDNARQDIGLGGTKMPATISRRRIRDDPKKDGLDTEARDLRFGKQSPK